VAHDADHDRLGPRLRRAADRSILIAHEKGGGPLSSDSKRSTREVPER
jgi:hypothetical protein